MKTIEIPEYLLIVCAAVLVFTGASLAVISGGIQNDKLMNIIIICIAIDMAMLTGIIYPKWKEVTTQ